MAQIQVEHIDLKQLLKDSLAETLNEQRDLLRDIFVEILEDRALGLAIHEGRQTERVDPEQIFAILAGRS